MTPAPRVLYIDMLPWHPSQALKLAGIRRYARLRGWEVVCVPREELRKTDIPIAGLRETLFYLQISR